MKFSRPQADTHVPSGGDLTSALAATTHLGIGAHADDLEIMAFPGICACRGQKNFQFSGVVATDGAGSPSKVSGQELMQTRMEEQRQAAVLGGYAAVIQLAYPSSEVRAAGRKALTADLLQIFQAAQQIGRAHV